MLTPLNNAVTVAKCASCCVLAWIEVISTWMGGFSKLKKHVEPTQPIDYVPITKRNGVLGTVANSVTGENWD